MTDRRRLDISSRRAGELLRRMRRQRLLVVGDVMLDEFIWGRVARISPEAPVPIVQVTGESFHIGGAGNVAANVRALGAEAVLVSALSEDPAGLRVRAALADCGIEPHLVITPNERPTTVKTRIVAHGQQVVRADREHVDPLDAPFEDALLATLSEAAPGCSSIVVSDYDKGIVTARLMRTVLALGRRHDLPVLVDPKVAHFPLYRGADVVTPNETETEQAAGVRIRSSEDVEVAGRRLLARHRLGALLVTRGEHGMSLFERGARPRHIPTAAREVYDVTGAGDTVIAALALARSAGARLGEAAILANHAAGVVVGKVGTATASPEELLASLHRASAES